MCDEWLNNFVAFYEWSMLNGYEEGLTIDRIDFNCDYCPENCRWIDRKMQANNTRRNIYIEIDGVVRTLSEWCEVLDISYNSVRTRLYKGWDVKTALTTPFGKPRRCKRKSLNI